MTSLTTRHHLGSRELADILAGDSYVLGGPDRNEGNRGAEVSRRQVDERVRLALALHGQGAYLSEDGWAGEQLQTDPEETAATAFWAARQVRRLYPVLDDSELASWLKEWTGDFDEDELYDE